MGETPPTSGAQANRPFLEMRGITKRYAVNQVLANDAVDLRVHRGEIHALVGENGAGKTTLMRILDGWERPDSGSILLQGKPAAPSSPREALRLGIGMVHQHFRLIPELTVAENIVLGEEPRRLGLFTDLSAASEAVKEVAARYGFTLNPSSRIRDLGLSRMQQVEIVKVLFRKAELIILDEPTTGLTGGQTEALFSGLRRLAAAGKTIILISHKLRDVLEISQRFTVLRRGRTVASGLTSRISQGELAALVMGGEAAAENVRRRVDPGETVYELRGVSLVEAGRRALDGVSFRVREGEVLAATGISGNGLEELEDVASGLRRPTEGEILHRGRDISRHDPRRLRRRGMAFVPADRLFRAVALEASLRENLIVNRRRELERAGVMLRSRMADFCGRLLGRFDIPADQDLPIGYLSGGGIQKVVLSRELAAGRDFFLFSEPTWGIDAGSTALVHNEILALRDRGAAVLLISTDLDEVLALSDRIAVVHGGRITAAYRNDERLARETVGLAMLGGEPA